MNFLKDQIADEQKKRESMQIEAHRVQQQLADQIRSLELELLSKVKEGREQQMDLWRQNDEDLARKARFSTDKTDEHTQAIKSMLTQLERKQEEDFMNRQRDMESLRATFEQKLVGMVEKIKLDEKQGLDRERRLMEQV